MQHTDCLGLRQLVVSAGLSLIILTVDCQAVYSQNNAVRNAAGVLILQNNRTQQELRETRRELKEIREGLGIESTTSGGAAPKSPNLIGVCWALPYLRSLLCWSFVPFG